MEKPSLWSRYWSYQRFWAKRSSRVGERLLTTWPKAWATCFGLAVVLEVYARVSWRGFERDLPYDLVFATFMAALNQWRLSRQRGPGPSE